MCRIGGKFSREECEEAVRQTGPTAAQQSKTTTTPSVAKHSPGGTIFRADLQAVFALKSRRF
jgi:hypothetical protein